MILKLIGAITFCFGGFLLGRSIEKQYAEKTIFWKEVLSFLTYCQSEIRHNGKTMDEICSDLRKQKGKYSVMIADAVQYNTIEEELRFLNDFSTEIATVDSLTQTKVFSRYEEDVKKKIEEAEKNHRKNGKNFQKIIPILCIGVAVLLW